METKIEAKIEKPQESVELLFESFASVDDFKKMKEAEYKEFCTVQNSLFAIIDERRKAVEKHPKFCDVLSELPKNQVHQDLKDLRFVNSYAPYRADALLMEEVYEAVEAYQEGDKEHCLQELAQCGAVILRMMEFVQNEREGEKE